MTRPTRPEPVEGHTRPEPVEGHTRPEPVEGPRTAAWIDATAGVAGDMLLAALVDAGAPLEDVQAAIDAVIPRSVRLTRADVDRGGQRAVKVEVEPLVEDPPHRTWASIRTMLADADLAPITRQRALTTFGRLADAEGHVHGVPADDVHFHEVGALDSIADVVGVCEAVRLLGIRTITASAVAVGSGRIKIAHGHIPVPVPAVAQLSIGWPIATNPQRPGDDPRPVGELATPTGVALIRALAEQVATAPTFTLSTVGIGGGTKDMDGWPNVVRVMIGNTAIPQTDPTQQTTISQPTSTVEEGLEQAVQLEANVDDLDPRLWPVVLDRLLAAGAMDAWLVPILMKKGRPAHTLCVLSDPARAGEIADVIFAETSTIGVRQHPVARRVLARRTIALPFGDSTVNVKVSHRDGAIIQATPEFDEVRAIATARALPTADVLSAIQAELVQHDLVPGAKLP